MRYRVRANVGWHWLEADVLPGSLTVHEDGPEDTGLVDEHGNPIYRMREPIGYRPADEREAS